MSEVIRVTSEALQSTIRDLLPSQNGFGDDLMASNVIIPTIDLTASAEGSQIGQNLQTALGFGSQTAFEITNSTSTIINNTGFFRVFGTVGGRVQSSAPIEGYFSMTDGLSTKKVWAFDTTLPTSTDPVAGIGFDFVVYLNAGESMSGTGNSGSTLVGSTRQIADINGNLINPVGFSIE